MKPIDRRMVLAMGGSLAAGAGLTLGPKSAVAAGAPVPGPRVAMLVYPGMVMLDLIGPMTVFNVLKYDVQLVWKDRSMIHNDLGLPLIATHTLEEVPRDPDVLFVPGGIMGTIECMNDPAVCAFLSEAGAHAKWVTAVCTGSLALAAAGLLKGYDATSHWTVAGLLPLMGARHIDKRVVRDRNRMTGGGVTAGIDFGLSLAAEISGEEEARRAQLLIEYAPEPPFQNGTPAEAGPARVAKMRAGRTEIDRAALAASTAAARRLGIV